MKMTRSLEVVLPHALAQHLSWAGDERNQLPMHHVQPGGITNAINGILLDRAITGLDVYGTYLMAGNGRNATQDLVDELADALMYITQIRLEGGGSMGDERAAKIQGKLLELLHMVVPDLLNELNDELDAEGDDHG
jgi:hypothetical protein